MPEAARTLEKAAQENWSMSRIAEELDVTIDEAEKLIAAFDRARKIVDAENPAEMFRNAVRFSIQDAAKEGLQEGESIEALVTQICYRASDLAFILHSRGETLSRYSRHLRKEPGVQYYAGYFDETDEAV